MLSLDLLHQLQTPKGSEALDAASALDSTDASLLRDLDHLRKQFSPDLAAAAIETVRLRQRARVKFSQADRMFFTREALEQASGEQIALHRGLRYQSVGTSVYDMCCSIGGDTAGMASRGLSVTGVDLDPLRLEIAAINMAVYDVAPRVALENADAQHYPVTDGALIFFDPARRRTGRGGSKRRVFQPDEYEPPLSLIDHWLEHTSGIGVKVAPGIDYDALPYACEVEIVSVDGDVKEACLWFGALQRHRRSATLLRSGSTTSVTLVGTNVQPVAVTAPQRYLYEPDGAVIRAHLVEQLATQIGAVKIDEQIALLTSDTLVESPFARVFEVYEVIPFNLKRLRTHLRELQVGRVVVKKRGSPIDPQVLEQQLRLTPGAPREMTLILTHVLNQPSVVLCNPVPPHGMATKQVKNERDAV